MDPNKIRFCIVGIIRKCKYKSQKKYRLKICQIGGTVVHCRKTDSGTLYIFTGGHRVGFEVNLGYL